MAPPNSPMSRLRVRAASQVERRELAWLWRGWLPFGKLALLDGDPGLGKSLVTLDMPIRIILSAIQVLFQTVTGRREKAKTSLARLKAATSFAFTGLYAFWKS